jgi:hypothetical protein
MTRRHYLQSLLIIGGVGIGYFSFSKWFENGEVRNPLSIDAWLGKKPLLAELADLIIPATDTPGAKEAGVGNYIVSIMLNCRDREQQGQFMAGIEDLEHFCFTKYGLPFLECDTTKKRAVLDHFSGLNLSKILLKLKNKLFGQSFFSVLQNLTVEGYCVSRLGATQGLAYDFVPGTFEPCTRLNTNQKSWATK